MQPKPRVFTTASGSTVVLGRCARQNDELTIAARSHEGAYWFHVAGVPGAHAILYPIQSEGTKPRSEDVYETARLALLHSKSPDIHRGSVIFCKASNVEKELGSRPGCVVARNTRTVKIG